MKKLLFFLCVAFWGKLQSQITPHNLFLVFDDTEGVTKTENIYIQNDKKDFCRTIYHYKHHRKVTEVMSKTKETYSSFKYRFEKRNIWSVEMSHTLCYHSKYCCL